jgi:hypothetical protein
MTPRVIYHSWPDCCGRWRPRSVVSLDILDKLAGVGNDTPCLRCLHGRRPGDATRDVWIIGYASLVATVGFQTSMDPWAPIGSST